MAIQDTFFVGFTITIEPILTNGDPDNGKYLVLGDGQRIDSISFSIMNNTQRMLLSYQGVEVTGYPQLIFMPFTINNNILNPIGVQSFTIISPSNMGDAFNSPICDLIRGADIFRISIDDENDNSQQIFVGAIEQVSISYGNGEFSLSFTVGNLPNILERSQLIRTLGQPQKGTIYTDITSQQWQLGNLIHQLLSETYINQTTNQTLYFGGITDGRSEIIASGKDGDTSGSALNADSYIYVLTPPTGTKLQVILATIFPYQRVFYVSPEGDFIITPLQTYFDEEENWVLDIFGDPDSIPLLDIRISNNTAILQNRAYSTLNQAFYSYSGTFSDPNNINGGYSLATPPQDLFPRAYDLVQSGKGLQTSFSVTDVNSASVFQNSGILNTAKNFIDLDGVKTVLILDNANGDDTLSDNPLEPTKYLTSLYSTRQLAESLLKDLLVDVDLPTVCTYSASLGRFRKIPLNQMVKVPTVNNKIFDGQTELFCYGFTLSWGEQGAITTLHLCKPYVFTALWCDSIEEI
jgi:hypothetical protein